jgi:hypothetical protein
MFTNLPDQCALVLTPNDSLELAVRVIGAVGRLKGWAGQP